MDYNLFPIDDFLLISNSHSSKSTINLCLARTHIDRRFVIWPEKALMVMDPKVEKQTNQ